jgi:hypothetical protein
MPDTVAQTKEKYFRPFCQELWGKCRNDEESASKLKEFLLEKVKWKTAKPSAEKIDLAMKEADAEKLTALLEPINLWRIKDLHQEHELKTIAPRSSSDQDLREFFGKDYTGILRVSDSNGSCHELNPDQSSKPFAIHSVGKVFTGVLIVEMIAQGIIPEEDLHKIPAQLDEEITNNLPEQVKARLQNVSLHQLMTHTSGLQDYLGNYFNHIEHSLADGQQVQHLKEPQEFLKFVEGSVATFEPGKGEDYSNAGILLAGMVAKHYYNRHRPADDKKPYSVILEELVLRPAGIGKFAATPPQEESLVNPQHTVASHLCGSPAGGYWTTAQEMEKFGKHLSKRWHDDEFRDKLEKYGSEFADTKNKIIKHPGGIPGDKSKGVDEGSTAWFSVDLESGVTVVAASLDGRAELLGDFASAAINSTTKENQKHHEKTMDALDRELGIGRHQHSDEAKQLRQSWASKVSGKRSEPTGERSA